MSSSIEQTAESITSEVKRAKQSEEELSSKITQTAESITSEVGEKYETKENATNTKNRATNFNKADGRRIYGRVIKTGDGN